jgi:putative transcriptional regulator
LASPPADGLINHIRRLRFEQGEMTQEELAGRVGVTRQTIIALEAGKYAPSLPLAFRLARAFGRNVEEVFQIQDDQQPTKGVTSIRNVRIKRPQPADE